MDDNTFRAIIAIGFLAFIPACIIAVGIAVRIGRRR